MNLENYIKDFNDWFQIFPEAKADDIIEPR
jgi:hypothetical protein